MDNDVDLRVDLNNEDDTGLPRAFCATQRTLLSSVKGCGLWAGSAW